VAPLPPPDVHGAIAASRAGDTDVLGSWLHEHFLDVNATVEEEHTLLHLASDAGQAESIKLLLAHGASTDIVRWHPTPCHPDPLGTKSRAA